MTLQIQYHGNNFLQFIDKYNQYRSLSQTSSCIFTFWRNTNLFISSLQQMDCHINIHCDFAFLLNS